MGRRKSELAEKYRAERMVHSFAMLRNCPLSARKVRLVADMVRGVEVNRALAVLRYAPQAAAPYMEKLLSSALANWGQKNPGERVEEANLLVLKLMVDEGRMLKRIRPRAQGRANRILKRSCYIYIEVGRKAGGASREIGEAVEENEVTK